MIIGQVKLSLLDFDHDGWYLMDGRNIIAYSELTTANGDYIGKSYREKSRMDVLPHTSGLTPMGATLTATDNTYQVGILMEDENANLFKIQDEHLPFIQTQNNYHKLDTNPKTGQYRYPVTTTRDFKVNNTTANESLETETLPKHVPPLDSNYGFRVVDEELDQEKLFTPTISFPRLDPEQIQPIDITPTRTLFANLFVYLGEAVALEPQPPPPPEGEEEEQPPPEDFEP